VTLPVVWIPEAHEDLQEALAWYDSIRPELRERFALAVETTVDSLGTCIAVSGSLPEPSACGSSPLPLRHILRGARSSDCGDSLLPRQAQSEALAIAVALVIVQNSPTTTYKTKGSCPNL
jgi:hypothetical protein